MNFYEFLYFQTVIFYKYYALVEDYVTNQKHEQLSIVTRLSHVETFQFSVATKMKTSEKSNYTSTFFIFYIPETMALFFFLILKCVVPKNYESRISIYSIESCRATYSLAARKEQL